MLTNVGAVSTLGSRVPSLLESISISNATQTFLDRLAADAPKFCPSSSVYNASAVKTKYDQIGSPALSGAEPIDTPLYSGVLAAQVAFIMFAETQG